MKEYDESTLLELIFHWAAAVIITIAAGCVLGAIVFYSVDGNSLTYLGELVILFIFLIVVVMLLLSHLLK